MAKKPKPPKPPYRVVLWSGGKDSTATIILAHEKGEPIDLVLMSLMWFDKKRKIPAENKKHLDWVMNYAKPLIESWGYKVQFVSSDKDYIYWFYKIRQSSEMHPETIGKYYGFVLGGVVQDARRKSAAGTTVPAPAPKGIRRHRILRHLHRRTRPPGKAPHKKRTALTLGRRTADAMGYQAPMQTVRTSLSGLQWEPEPSRQLLVLSEPKDPRTRRTEDGIAGALPRTRNTRPGEEHRGARFQIWRPIRGNRPSGKRIPCKPATATSCATFTF